MKEFKKCSMLQDAPVSMTTTSLAVDQSEALHSLKFDHETIKRLRKLVLRYSKNEKPFDRNFTNKTYLLDLLYFLGLAIDEDKFYAAQGFDEFKKLIKEVINGW